MNLLWQLIEDIENTHTIEILEALSVVIENYTSSEKVPDSKLQLIQDSHVTVSQQAIIIILSKRFHVDCFISKPGDNKKSSKAISATEFPVPCLDDMIVKCCYLTCFTLVIVYVYLVIVHFEELHML